MHRLITLVMLAAAVAAPLAAQPAPAIKANRVIIRVADLKSSIAFFRAWAAAPIDLDEFAVFGGDGMTLMLRRWKKSAARAPGCPH
jgi:hypothetical protein